MSEKLLLDNMEALMKAFKELKEIQNQNDKTPNIVVESLDEDEEEEVIPEAAGPFQALDFSKKEPLSLNEAADYFEQESKAVSEFP